MKKMRNGRRGFTLLEIVIVVAIIVILSTGAFLGVAATVNRASDAQARLEADNGENFEAYARNQVDSYGKNMVYWDPIPNYTPENQAKKMKEQMLAEGWTDGEITFEYQTDGWHIVAEWDPTLDEHRGFQTPEDYKLWKSNYDNYLKLGYTIAEIEAGCKNGSTEIKPVWNPGAHNDMTEEAYLKQLQGGNGSGDSGSGSGGSSAGFVTYAETGSNGTAKVNEVTVSGNTQTIKMTSLDGNNAGQIWITIEKRNDGYYATVDGSHGAYVFVNNGLEGANYDNKEFKINDSGKTWLKNNYGITLE